MKNKICILVSVILIFISFFAWMEYKSYQVRSALQEAFTDDISTNENTISDVNLEVIEKNKIEIKMWESVTLSTIELKVITSEEKNVLTSTYWKPRIAEDWTKFLLLELSIKNILNETFYDSFSDLSLVDNKGNKYLPIDVIWNIDNYISRDFQPLIEEKGFIVYKLPVDSSWYSLTIWKSGTNDMYYIDVN